MLIVKTLHKIFDENVTKNFIFIFVVLWSE